MPGWFPAPRAGLALGDDTSGPLIDLFALADRHRWMPFDASRRWLGVRWGGKDSPWGSNRVRGLLRLFAEMRWIEVMPGNRVDPQRIRCFDPRSVDYPDWCVVSADAARCVSGVAQLAAVARMAAAGVFDNYANPDQIGHAETRTTTRTTSPSTTRTTDRTTDNADVVGACDMVRTTSQTTTRTTDRTTTRTEVPDPDPEPETDPEPGSPEAQRLRALLLATWHDGPDDKRLGPIEGRGKTPSLLDWCETMATGYPGDIVADVRSLVRWETSQPPSKRKRQIRRFLANNLNRGIERRTNGDTTNARHRRTRPAGAHNGRSQAALWGDVTIQAPSGPRF